MKARARFRAGNPDRRHMLRKDAGRPGFISPDAMTNSPWHRTTGRLDLYHLRAPIPELTRASRDRAMQRQVEDGKAREAELWLGE